MCFLVELYFVAVVRVVVVVGCSSRSKFAESDDVCGWLVGTRATTEKALLLLLFCPKRDFCFP